MANNKKDIYQNHISMPDGKKYIFNIDKLKEILTGSVGQKETTVAYDLDNNTVSAASSRVIREVETKDKSFSENLIYDFIKLLTVTILEWPVLDNYQPSPGLTIAIGTLKEYEILKEIKEEKN